MFIIAAGNPSFKPKFAQETEEEYSKRKKIAAIVTAIDTLVVTPLIVFSAYYLEPADPMTKPSLFAFAGFSVYPAGCAISELVRQIFNCREERYRCAIY